MDIAMVGLGRMGAGLSRRLMERGHRVVAYDRSQEAVDAVTADGADGASSLEEMVQKLSAPRVVWVMVPAGDPTEASITTLGELLEAGDVVIDGGNSNFHDSVRRAEALDQKGVRFLDAGTSGGVWGLKEGFCLMVGGPDEAFALAEPIFADLTLKGGYAHVGPAGAGHYVKMVHNGIEYGMLQAYAEGFEILHHSDYTLDLDQISKVWQYGSVIRSWLLELLTDAFDKDPNLDQIRGYVEDSGEGRWTVLEAMEKSVPAPIITMSLLARFRSRQDDSFSAKVVAALRNEFGGHAVRGLR